METKNLLERIIINPDIMVGKPIIKGTRITVGLILDLLAQGIEISEILTDYPHLQKEDIFACLIYAKEAVENPTFMPLGS